MGHAGKSRPHKRLGEELIDRQPGRFGRDFSENKAGVGENVIILSFSALNEIVAPCVV
jgi:ribosomal protein S17E